VWVGGWSGVASFLDILFTGFSVDWLLFSPYEDLRKT
jgi:hypothetical protein